MKGLSKEKGQGLVEYGFVIVLIAVIVLAVLLILGPIIVDTFSEVTSELERVSYVWQIL